MTTFHRGRCSPIFGGGGGHGIVEVNLFPFVTSCVAKDCSYFNTCGYVIKMAANSQKLHDSRSAKLTFCAIELDNF